MRILMLTPHAPFPPNSGGRIRQWHQIKHLSRHHDLTMVVFMHPAKEHGSMNVLEEVCRRVIPVMPPGERSQAVGSEQVRGYGPGGVFCCGDGDFLREAQEDAEEASGTVRGVEGLL